MNEAEDKCSNPLDHKETGPATRNARAVGAADPKALLHAQVKALSREFVRSLPGRMAKIEALWAESRKSTLQTQQLEALHHEVHTLTGSGGTFGFPAVSMAAHALEARLEPFLAKGIVPDEETLYVEALIQGLKAQLPEEGNAP